MKNAVTNHAAQESPSSVHLQALSNAPAPPGRRIVSKTRGLSGTAPYEPLRRRRRRAHPRPRAGCVGRSGERPAGRIGGCHAYWSARSSSSETWHALGVVHGDGDLSEMVTRGAGRTARPPRCPVDRRVPIDPCDDVSWRHRHRHTRMRLTSYPMLTVWLIIPLG